MTVNCYDYVKTEVHTVYRWGIKEPNSIQVEGKAGCGDVGYFHVLHRFISKDLIRSCKV